MLHVIHLLLRQAKSFRIYAENFHPGGLRKWSAPQESTWRLEVGDTDSTIKNLFILCQPAHLRSGTVFELVEHINVLVLFFVEGDPF